MKILLPFTRILTLLVFSSPVFASEPPQNSEVILEDNFERTELGKGWTTQTGSWSIEEGILKGSEIPADKHAAAARRVLETGNAVYQLKFKFIEGAKAFHFGFDPKRGTLDKKGHLFSIIVTPADWKLMKHVDKAKPKEDPNEVLASAKHTFQPGTWHTLRVTARGTSVKAMIDDLEPLSGTHPSFAVPKPTLVFRVVGEAVQIDDLKVWVLK